MSFSNIIRKKNHLLIPLSWLYIAGVFIYHKLYDTKILKSYQPNIKTICVGNLSVGGTGKSPMVEYLVKILQVDFVVATLSRGYKRNTNGFVLAGANTNTDEIGDEPMQFHQKFPKLTVAVDEKRSEGIDILLKQIPGLDVIILDDAFQHRAVTPGLNILLTEYNNLFTGDNYLPAGTLRDLKSNYKRAEIIIVTKTHEDITLLQRQQVLDKIKPSGGQKVFFTAIKYGTAYNIFNNEKTVLSNFEEIILVTGIANPQPLLNHLNQLKLKLQHLKFSDHHRFTKNDIGDILGTYRLNNIKNKIILTTEKDAARLRSWNELKEAPVFALPIKHHFLFNEATDFENAVMGYLSKA